MADKLTDEDLAKELKRYGETVKQPIDYKKRPILVKKLNHFYARENAAQRKAKTSGRRSKAAVAPEFSDDSQDENETEVSRLPVFRKTKSKSAVAESSTRTLRNRKIDNGTLNSDSDSLLDGYSGKKKRYSVGPQVEIYPEEFSDQDDTAEESVYEVEEQSIGVNTSMNFDDTADELPSFSIQSKNRSTVKLSPPSVRPSPNANRNNYGVQGKANQLRKTSSSPESGHLISKTILLAMAIFFVVLAACYMYIKRDILLSQQAALEQNDLKGKRYCDQFQKDCYEQDEVTNALLVLQEIHKELTVRKGQYEIGAISDEQKQLDRSDVAKRAENILKLNASQVGRMTDLCMRIIMKHGKSWDIMAFTSVGVDATRYDEIATIESVYGDLAFVTRLKLAFVKVLYGLCLFVACLFLGVLGIFYVRWQNKKKEKQQQKVYDLVEKIIEILQENLELAEKKNDEKKYPPYMATQHIRDQLIPVAERKSMQWLWEEAVKFIEKNESRIRVETQMIKGEEFTVWRWLQAVPNGHKVWQGQAFGETSQNNVNSLPYGPTPCLKVRNMFDARTEQSTDDWHLDVEESILEKCKTNNGILHIFVDRTSKEGCVYIKCSSCEKAYEAYQELHGWWFDGRLVTVKYLRLEHYHDRFPDSRNRRRPLKPSNNEMQSLSSPYHKSALEMT